jgi:hypothetical protein
MSVAEVNGEDFKTMANKKDCRKKVFTNADRIRAMSDEELADIMSMHTATGACNDWGIPHEKCGGNCRECIIDWLRQPAE